MMKHLLFLFFVVIFYTGSLQAQKTKAQSTTTPPVSRAIDDPKVKVIELHAYPCRGWCPVYDLVINTDRSLHFEGIKNTGTTGKKTVKLTAAELDRLKKKIQTTNPWNYPDTIKSQIMDGPHTTLVIYKNNGKPKTIHGTVDLPAPIQELQDLVNRMAESHGLKLKKDEVPPVAGKFEALVKLKKDVNAGNWIAQFTKVHLQLVRKFSADNTWIISYNQTEISEKALFEMLKKSADVLNVQPNNKENRD